MKTSGWILVGLAVLFWAGVGWQLLKYPENHIGFSVLWMLPYFTAMIIVGTKPLFKGLHINWGGWIMVGLGVASAIAVILLYHLNILIPYEVWIERGLPARPF